MDKKKIISLIAVLAVAGGSIWYLESLKAAPPSGSAGSTQTIGFAATSSGQTATSSGSPVAAQSALSAIAAKDRAAGDQPAIEIADPTGFVNATSGFKLSDFVGKKVVLLDFWTYSCINCIRTLPYLTSWYQKYKDQGLVIVGIHTPEFDFEKNIDNVQAAAKQYGITYPIVLDSNYGTWNAYGNLYWPHEYLIDIAGYIVHDHVGEGSYDETEGIIQQLLAQRAMALGASTSSIASGTVNVAPSDLNGIGSPETYFGSGRNEFLANGRMLTDGVQMLAIPQTIALNHLYLGGTWNFIDQYATNQSAGAKIDYKYDSANVYFVASGAPQGTVIDVMQDGKPISAADAGSDVRNGKLTVTGSRLYNIVRNADGSGEHTLELIIESPGLQAFTFTFG